MQSLLATGEAADSFKAKTTPCAEPQTARQYWVCEVIHDPFRIGHHVYQGKVLKFIAVAYCTDKKSADSIAYHTGRFVVISDVFNHRQEDRFLHKKNFEIISFYFPAPPKRLP
ncbi:MAG: hypothetical protein NTZ49_03330 [Candidatus Parcubacteria bacterium]|nr:hypothetical protein [Candidatus Parcubacteria bacterium]